MTDTPKHTEERVLLQARVPVAYDRALEVYAAKKGMEKRGALMSFIEHSAATELAEVRAAMAEAAHA